MFYLKQGNDFTLSEEGAVQLYEKLPVGTYTIALSPVVGYYFKIIDDFNVEGKLYGNVDKITDRVLNTFSDRPFSTGVLLAGEKGSGKTMQAKVIATKARDLGMPTVVINNALAGEGFNQFVQSLDQPMVFVFDEFEKVYGENEQEQILTLFDGVYPTKKLFVLTVNNKYAVNQHMRNRPGRIFYSIDYKGLEIEFIREYCQENLKEQKYLESMCRLPMFFDAFNFDMLKALVEEMNRYGESPQQAIQMLNAKPFSESSALHEVTVFRNGNVEEVVYPDVIRGNPLQSPELTVQVGQDPEDYDEDSDEYRQAKAAGGFQVVNLTPDMCQNIDSEKGTFTYHSKTGVTVVFKRKEAKTYDYSNAF